MNIKAECAKCTKVVCYRGALDKVPANCTTNSKLEVIERLKPIFADIGKLAA